MASDPAFAKVAVVTRTKDRAVTLRRAAESIINQTCQDLAWVIVNDGGDPGPVDEIAEDARKRGTTVIAVHNPKSVGMEAASNIGIRSSNSTFIVLLDDDDSWDETFLQQTVAFLEKQRWCAGVAVQTFRVYEEIGRNDIHISHFAPLNPQLAEVFMLDVAGWHPFTINAFLFRREVLSQIGYFSEDLPLGGDYEFHLRFIEKFDIGVIPRPLAFYHLRTAVGEYANSAPTGASVDIREIHKNTVRDRLLRRDLREERLGIGALALISAQYRNAGQRLEIDYAIIDQLLKARK